MYSWLLLLLLLVLIGISLYMRIINYRTPKATAAVDKIEIKNTPLSTAVQELIATAGGIYLSLIMLISFLKIELPEKISIGILSLDPIAFTSIGLAIIQPFIIKIFLRNSR